jgi:hypothetical protein
MPSLFGTDGRSGLPQTTRSQIYYEIESCTPKERWVPGANDEIVVLRIDARDRATFITDMVGRTYSRSGGSSGANILQRDLPESNPFNEQQWCSRLEQVDQGGDPASTSDASPGTGGPGRDMLSGWPRPMWIKYRATFEGMPFELLTDDDAATQAGSTSPATMPELQRYVVRSRRARVREQQVPAGGWYVVPSTPPAGRIPGLTFFKRIVMADVQYTLVRWPVSLLPITAMSASQGCVNDNLFDNGPGGYSFPADTLLFTGWDDTNRYWDANGDWVCDLVQFYEYKLTGQQTLFGIPIASYGWNYFLTPTGQAVQVSSDGTASGMVPYNSANFNNNFRAGP